jgi:transcriptional regulator with XRE-family HTH domain
VPNLPGRVGDVGTYLREQREHAKLSVRQLAALAGVSNPYLSQIERGLRKPSAEVLQQLAKGLRISAEALYLRAGILDGEQGFDVQLAVHADPTLSERQKRVLIDLYTAFLEEHGGSGEPPPDRSFAPDPLEAGSLEPSLEPVPPAAPASRPGHTPEA